MPCEKCNSQLIFLENKLVCPICNKLKILDRNSALQIADKRRSYIRDLWKKELIKLNRDSLVCHILDNRNTLSWDVFQKPGITDIDGLFSDTLFIKRIFEDGNKNGTIMIDNTNKSKPIIELFNDTKKCETDYYLVESGNATYIYENDFKINLIVDDQVLTNFTFVETEDYEIYIRNFEKNNIVSRNKAKELQQENAEEFKKIMENRQPPISQTMLEFIERNYDTITSYYLVFLRNEIYSKVFDLRKFERLMSDPRKLMELVKKFESVPYVMNGPNYSEFMKNAIDVFGKSETEIAKSLIFEEDNSDIFPLFIRIKIEGKDIILLSQTFTAIMFILLHAVLSKKEKFDLVAHKRGLDFEKNVQKKFESLGFGYIPNYKDEPVHQTLEIDGIASKNDLCFVIEAKNPRLFPEVESFKSRENMITDLKGIIDGEKRKIDDGKNSIEQVTSLPKKVEYVKTHLSELGLAKVSADKIFGVVITNNYPLISEYKGCAMVSLSDISNSKLEEITRKTISSAP